MRWVPADDDGCHFGHHFCRRMGNDIKMIDVDKNKLVTTLIYDFLPDFFIRDLDQHHGRVSSTLDRENHQLHVTGGADRVNSDNSNQWSMVVK